MKSLELQPTYENLIKTFWEDSIGRNADIVSFADILNSLDDSCAIALDAKWGAGKTFFVKQTKMVLDAFNDFIPSFDENDKAIIKSFCDKKHRNNPMVYIPQVSVYYDAWANDNDEDPVLSLVLSIIKSIDVDFSFKQGTDSLTKAAAVLEFFTGKSFTDLLEGFRSDNPLDIIQKSKGIEELVKEFLDSLLEERGDRLVVFIDELDRCRPDYAVRLLERIKHYFSNERITFVFAINSLELQHTIKKYYGESFDASRYLDRFFDLRVSLPPIDKKLFYNSIGFNDSSNYYYDMVCRVVIEKFDFSLREIAKFIRLTKIAAYKPTHEEKNSFHFSDALGFKFCLFYFVPIMIGLRIRDTSKYEDFITGRDFSPVEEIINSLGSSCFSKLLSPEETFDTKDSSMTLVTVKEKVYQVYEAVFITEYDYRKYQTDIGDYSFNSGLKEELIKISGLMSKYADIEKKQKG